MAGHSHAANVAARKGAVDAQRGKLFSKLCRAIYVAATVVPDRLVRVPIAVVDEDHTELSQRLAARPASRS